MLLPFIFQNVLPYFLILLLSSSIIARETAWILAATGDGAI